MIAVVVATPLQLFNSMMIMRHHYPAEKCDLIALTFACNMKAVVDNYTSIDIIRNVFYMKCAPDYKTKLGKVLNMLFPNKMQRDVLRNLYRNSYSVLLTTFVGETSSWLYSKLIRLNPNLKLCFYEEGMGVYVSSIITTQRSNRVLYKLFGYEDYGDHIERLYMYRPDIGENVNRFTKRISIGTVTDDDKKSLKGLLSHREIKPYNCRAVYFEGGFSLYKKYELFDEMYLIDRLESFFNYGEMIIRAHPRSDANKYLLKGYEVDPNRDITWEEILFSDRLSEDILFITVFSSVCCTAKFIYDFEPRIMILGKMIKNEYSDKPWANYFCPDDLQNLLDNLRVIYRDPTRIMIPESYEEMEQMIVSSFQS